MENESKKQTGHSIITYRVRLYDRHFSWLENTKELYVRTAEHFLAVLQKEEQLLQQSDFLLLRALETKCIGTKDMKAAGVTPEYPLAKTPKIPLYFRRSAINAAIALARKKAGSGQQDENGLESPQNSSYSMLLYKGMYQNFGEKSIELKLFNGEKWVWVNYPFAGRTFPESGERLSPTLLLEKKEAYLLVPISMPVSDVRTVKERMETEESICTVYFPDHDVLAAAVILSKDGKELDHRFFRGGKQKEHQRRRLLEQIKESQTSRGMEQRKIQELTEKENARLFEDLREINKYYAHSISRQILDYCLEKGIKVIVVPNYEAALDFTDKKYLKTDGYRWLGRAIIKNLKYKAFRSGIVVTSIRPYHISDRCSECGATIRKYNEGHTAGQNYHGGKLFVCPNGHKGNAAKNAARNVGKNFLAYYNEGS